MKITRTRVRLSYKLSAADNTMKTEKGFSLLELLIVVAIIGIIAGFAIPSLLESKKSANEASAISGVRTLVTAQMTYSSTVGAGNYAADVSALISAELVDEMFSTGKDGYTFSTTGSGTDNFTINADPVNANSGKRHFFADESGVVRISTDGPANASCVILNQG